MSDTAARPDPSALEANARRFHGFAPLYDRVRPSPPESVGQLILAYAAMERARLVVDLGSGTGLSTRWAAGWSDAVIGVEPGDDMRHQAEAAAGSLPGVQFRAGWGHDTGLDDGCADAVVAVQAFHWMDPVPTLAEIARVLRPGGVFAALDCDFRPSTGRWEAEAAWERCRAITVVFENRIVAGLTGSALHQPLPESYASEEPTDAGLVGGGRSWEKSEHLSRMAASGRFRWCAEVAAQAVEPGDGARFVALFHTQGHTQQLLAAGLTEEQLGLKDLAATTASALGPTACPFWFTYRVRLAVK